MKNFAKKTLYGILLSSFVMGGFLVFFSLIPQAHADSLSGYTFLAPLPTNPDSILTDLSDYLKYLFITVVGVAIVLAVIVIVIGGIQYSIAIVPSGKEAGKKKVTSAIFGLLLILMSYVIIDAVNPQLLQVGLNIPHIDLPQGTTGGGSGGGGGGGGQFAPNTLCIITVNSCNTGAGCTEYQDADICTQNEQLADSQGVPSCDGDLTGWQKCIAKTCSATTATFPKKCSQGGGGSGGSGCVIQTSGPCTPDNLAAAGFPDSSWWSRTCTKESGGRSSALNTNFLCADGSIFAVGLFQMNLTANPIYLTSGGKLDCPSAFTSVYGSRDHSCRVKNSQLYNDCKSAAMDPNNNILSALKLSNGGTRRGPWKEHGCSYP